MPLANYSFLEFLWLMIVFFAFVVWIWLLITVFSDLFRRKDISGGKKALWIIFIIVAWYLGVLVYIIAEHDGMADRSAADLQQAQAQQDAYIKSVAQTSSADQVAQAKQLLDSGAITQQEYEVLKAKALAP